MKFIHLTDTHIPGENRLLYGANPRQCLATAIDSINNDHSDAEFVVLTGDITHWGNQNAYEEFKAEVSRLTMPIHLMVGNHDDTPAFVEEFPNAPRDPNGFVQQSFRAANHTFVLLDTKANGTHAGAYCEKRREWLSDTLENSEGPALLFMHHPPFKVGIAGMDNIMLQQAEAFTQTIAPYADKIQHLFFGHVHRMICGSWNGISYSCMRGLNHQVALDLSGNVNTVPGDLANPAYGVVLLETDQVTVHMHDFTDNSPSFTLEPPQGSDGLSYQLNMRHDAWR